MAETEQTKICPFCAETIKAAAKVCPHCRYWQKKWSLQNPQTMQSAVALLVAVLMIGAIAGMGLFYNTLFGPKRNFAQYQNRFKVVNAETSFHVVDSNLMVTVVGVITNQSTFGWKEIGVEAQFFDEDGKMIDVIPALGEYNDLDILPHSDADLESKNGL